MCSIWLVSWEVMYCSVFNMAGLMGSDVLNVFNVAVLMGSDVLNVFNMAGLMGSDVLKCVQCGWSHGK